jgi:hypothetical protein
MNKKYDLNNIDVEAFLEMFLPDYFSNKRMYIQFGKDFGRSFKDMYIGEALLNFINEFCKEQKDDNTNIPLIKNRMDFLESIKIERDATLKRESNNLNCLSKQLEEFLKNSKNIGGAVYLNPESRLVKQRDLSILAERLEKIEAQLKTLIETKNDQ